MKCEVTVWSLASVALEKTDSRAQSRKEVSYKKLTNSSDIQQVCSSSNDCRRPRSISAIDCMKLGFA